MALIKNSGRQELIAAYQDISVADLVTNVALNVMQLPVGAVVVSGDLVTTEAWNSSTSDVMDVGDAGLATRYMTDGNIHALGSRVPINPTGFVVTSAQPYLTVTWTSGGGTPTTGKVRLAVQYYVVGRAEFAQG
jgi:hypothetical protein